MIYRLSEVYFMFDKYEFTSGKIDYDSEPKELVSVSTVDKGTPVLSLRDPNTVVHIFNLEVDFASDDYEKLNAVLMSQNSSMEMVTRGLLFDNCYFKLATDYAFIAEQPSVSYASDVSKVTFIIKAIKCKITKLDKPRLA